MVKVKKHEGQIEQIPTAELIPYIRNARTHSEIQVAQIARTLSHVVWKFCTENDCYAVAESGDVYRVCRRQKSKSGRVVSKYETVILKGSIDKDGYRVFRMMVDGVKKHVKGHRLVLNAFAGCQPLLDVNHKDGNKLNNSRTNLEWLTTAQNNAHAIATGLNNPRALNPKNAKVLRCDYVTIHILHNELGISRAVIAKANGVCRQTIDNVLRTAERELRSIHAAT
jgi:hypothetical protein